MKLIFILLCIATVLYADKTLYVVTSVPDLTDIALQIGGDAVTVISLSTGKEDLHAVPARPSFLPKLNRADLLLTLGLDAEHSWLPAVVAEARNPKIRQDGPGWVDCSKGIAILEKPVKLDRSEGEQHPEGNPHYNIGPQCGMIMIANIKDAFCNAMPARTDYFSHNARLYQQQLDTLMLQLRELGTSLNGVSIIEYHPDVAYLCSFYGMKIVGSIEPKAGVPPTGEHLKFLQQSARESNVRLIIYNQSQNPKIPRKLATGISCSAVRIANAVGAHTTICSWIELHRFNLRVLLDGLSEENK